MVCRKRCCTQPTKTVREPCSFLGKLADFLLGEIWPTDFIWEWYIQDDQTSFDRQQLSVEPVQPGEHLSELPATFPGRDCTCFDVAAAWMSWDTTCCVFSLDFERGVATFDASLAEPVMVNSSETSPWELFCKVPSLSDLRPSPSFFLLPILLVRERIVDWPEFCVDTA